MPAAATRDAGEGVEGERGVEEMEAEARRGEKEARDAGRAHGTGREVRRVKEGRRRSGWRKAPTKHECGLTMLPVGRETQWRGRETVRGEHERVQPQRVEVVGNSNPRNKTGDRFLTVSRRRRLSSADMKEDFFCFGV